MIRLGDTMTADEFAKEFVLDPTAARAMGYVSNPAVIPDDSGTVVTMTAMLLDRETHHPANKWLYLQMANEDALSLAVSILALAKDAGLTLSPEALDLVGRIPLGTKGKH
jgi:hypothetical protein